MEILLFLNNLRNNKMILVNEIKSILNLIYKFIYILEFINRKRYSREK